MSAQEYFNQYIVPIISTCKHGFVDVVTGNLLTVVVYLAAIHCCLIAFVVYVFINRKETERNRRNGTRVLRRDNRVVTMETCEWFNSILAWVYLHSKGKSAPDLLRTWIRNLNHELEKETQKGQIIAISNITTGWQPPVVSAVNCLKAGGTMQCITFRVETSQLGFCVTTSQPSSNGTSKVAILEVKVVRLTGEVAIQLTSTPYRLELNSKFIGKPEIDLSTNVISKDEVDAATIEAVEEKVKQVICKTVTNIPLTEAAKQEEGSLGKDRFAPPILKSCLGEEGKLLVKVIKAMGLTSKEHGGNISPYCIISTGNPHQRKRTSLLKDTHNPFWNEYFALDINSKTRELTIDIYDYERTPSDVNHHMDDHELTQEQDDFLGQVIVPLSTVNRDQTCRLVLPILPRTNKCDYVSGELSLEFDFDKDGKVIDKKLPLVETALAKAQENPVVEDTFIAAESTKAEVEPELESVKLEAETNGPPSSVRSFAAAYSYSLDKRYMETSLDELAFEIEAYEAESRGETKPSDVIDETDEAAERLVTMDPVFETTEVVEEAQEPTPDPEKLQKELCSEEKSDEAKLETVNKTEEVNTSEEPEASGTPEPKLRTKKSFASKFKKRPKSTADMDKIEDETGENNRHSYHPGDTIEETGEEGGAGINPEPKSKIRRSFNMKFRRSKKASATEENDEREQENKEKNKVEEEEKKSDNEETTPDPPKSRFGKFKWARKDDKKDEGDSGEHENESEKAEDKNEKPAEPTKEGVPAEAKLSKSRLSKFKKRKADKEHEKVEKKEEDKDTSKPLFGKLRKKAGDKEMNDGEAKQEKATEIKNEKDGSKEDDKEEEEKSEQIRDKKEDAVVNEDKQELEKQQQAETQATPEKAEKLETLDENAEAEPAGEKPTPRLRKFNLKFGRQRPMSMSAFDKQKPGTSANDDTKQDERVRHSYHAGDLSEHAPLSRSQTSLLSYSPNPNSTLIIETSDKGQKTYYHIPQAMAKRGTYEQKGVKYHVYNEHMFRADHLGETTECAVCAKSIIRKPGKQAYRCKDCKMTCHKKCHSQTTVICSSSTIKTLEIKDAPNIVGN
ncbi:uncharacterized protein LOC5502205 isoform X3 [Nematostella vectensis]|uniref:uncharacterized protein LOC5502205 isoform X3 n=1 Tax=Nematostella vectensis TaxID=45351 RepID=UPI0020771A12|nr:uncharacterized protein LOC5502205 isoform X3 [Nematostella vectensis]